MKRILALIIFLIVALAIIWLLFFRVSENKDLNVVIEGIFSSLEKQNYVRLSNNIIYEEIIRYDNETVFSRKYFIDEQKESELIFYEGKLIVKYSEEYMFVELDEDSIKNIKNFIDEFANIIELYQKGDERIKIELKDVNQEYIIKVNGEYEFTNLDVSYYVDKKSYLINKIDYNGQIQVLEYFGFELESEKYFNAQQISEEEFLEIVKKDEFKGLI